MLTEVITIIARLRTMAAKVSRSLWNSRTAWILLSFGLLVVVWLFWGSILRNWFGLCDEQAVFLSNTYGVLSTFFSGIALIGIVYTIFQHRWLFQIERFEDKFFRLLEVHNKSKESLWYNPKNGSLIKGIDVFQDFEATRSTNEFSCRASRDNIQTFVEKRFYNGNLYVYFRLLQNLLEHIDGNRVAGDLDFYIKIVWSHRSIQEQTALLLYGLTSHGEEIRHLVNKHNFLRDYPPNIPVPPWMLEEYPGTLKEHRTKNHQ